MIACCDSKGMADGVRSSAVFVLFLSKDVLQRPFVRFETEEALKHKKQILLVLRGAILFLSIVFIKEVWEAMGFLPVGLRTR